MIKMGNILLKPKQALIIIALRDSSQNWYISTLAKSSGTTYVHACNFLAACEGMGITTSEKHGKIKLVKLTEKGTRLADLLIGINQIITAQEPQPKAAQEKPAES